MSKIIAIVGPTAIGKSLLAIKLASRFDGEIVNADSRQIYRHLDIGTGKPGQEILATIPHHLIGVVNPNQDFNLALYQDLAYKSIGCIIERGNLPFLVGGSGQYVWSILEGWNIPRVTPNRDYREELETKMANEGFETLVKELEDLNPNMAAEIDRKNPRRVIRALEITSDSKYKVDKSLKKEAHFQSLIIGLTTNREILYDFIDKRVDRMIEKGLVAEVIRLLKKGYGPDLSALSAIGYCQIIHYLKGELTLPAAIRQIKWDSHRYARQQYNWFSSNDARINWIKIGSETEYQTTELIKGFLAG